MRRITFALSLAMLASTLIGAAMQFTPDELFRLSGWAEIPSAFRQPGPVSGQFTTPNNGVTPPYQGQPIPGFSGSFEPQTCWHTAVPLQPVKFQYF